MFCWMENFPPDLSTAGLAGELRVARARALRGANLWEPEPVVQAELRAGALMGTDPASVAGLREGLEAALPFLTGIVGDAERPASWPTLLLEATRELLRLAGARSDMGRVVAGDEEAERWTLAFPYNDEEVALDAVHAAARVLRDCIRGDDPEIAPIVGRLRERLAEEQPSATERLVVAAARKRGIPVRRGNDEGVVQLGLGATRRRLRGAMSDFASGIAVEIAGSEAGVWRVLDRVGISTPLDPAAPEGGADTHHALVIDGSVLAVVEVREGRSADCTGTLHPDNRALLELAAGAIGLGVAELRVSAPDVAVPFRSNGGMVTGVSASPQLERFVGTASGAPRDVGGAIVDMLYPRGARTTIPVIAVTGTNGKTTTTRLIAHLFRASGRRVGFTTTDGVYFQEQQLMRGDLTGPFAANVVLSHPHVEAAVLETARGGILKSGLGFDRCDVGVITNVTADHLGLRGIDTLQQLADVKAVIARAVKDTGHLVLNADDPLVYAMRERATGRIALFSMAPAGESAEVEEQLARGVPVARVEEEAGAGPCVVIRQGEERLVLAPVADVPLTFGGLARFQVQNVLAGALAAHVQGIHPDVIRQGLMSFRPSAEQTPGRLNLIETTRGRVLIDYAHNAAAVSALMELLQAMPAQRRIALLSAPGDRRDEDLSGLGALATRLDLVIFKEHEVYRRGREPGAINAIMRGGLLATGFPAERTLSFVEEHEAVAHVMEIMRQGDVVVIVADDTAAVRQQLAPIMREADRTTS